MSSKLSLTFRIYKHGQLIRVEKLAQNVIKIGRVPSAHLQLDDDAVSRMHAIIEVTGGDVSLIDLGSAKGTFVNGARIHKARLAAGDALTLGDLRVEIGIDEVTSNASAEVQRSAPPPVPTPAPLARVPAAAPASAVPATVAPAGLPASATFRAPELDHPDGARAVEVAAMFGDSVVGVKHCMDPRGGKVTMATWVLAGAGLACLVSSGIAFASSVGAAADNQAARAYHTNVLKKPEWSFRPRESSPVTPVLAFGGLALGLIGLTSALVRARNEARSPFYRIGTAPGVELAISTAPSPSFPLVAPSGDDFVLTYAPGIEGDMVVDGASVSLADLAASGRGRPSTTTAGAIEIPIPERARIRARSGNTTFVVSAVAKPARHAVPMFAALESRALAYVGGSLAVHMGMWAVLNAMPPDAAGANVELSIRDESIVSVKGTTTEEVPPEVEPEDRDGSGDSEGMGAKMALREGEAGRPDVTTQGHIRIAKSDRPPALSKAEIIQRARDAGVMGASASLAAAVGTLASEYDYASGFDNVSVYGNLYGADGEGKGVFGGGRSGLFEGGGCTMPPCGTIGTSNYGTIGTGTKAGDGWSGPGTGWGRRDGRTARVPVPVLGRPITEGDLDKATIRRYIKRSINKISYCYEKELLANPTLGGTITVQFMISGTGKVQAATGSGFHAGVSECVADVVQQIEFPTPRNGGSVQVNYPFNFHRSGS